jgi:hypothetical protein
MIPGIVKQKVMSNVIPKFLLLNLNSEVQPLDLGVIQAVKASMMMLQYPVTTMQASNMMSDFKKSITPVHTIQKLSSLSYESSQDITVKCFQRTDIHYQKEDEECEQDTSLAKVVVYFPLDIQKDVIFVSEMESAADIIMHKQVSSSPEEIFLEMEEPLPKKSYVLKMLKLMVIVT